MFKSQFKIKIRKLPIGDPDVDWEETIYLNLIIHLFDYKITLAICSRTSPTDLQVTFLTAVLFLKCLIQYCIDEKLRSRLLSRVKTYQSQFRKPLRCQAEMMISNL